ncbi:hypothetical protein ElyMa_006170300 [Elysia marginata]|uniref:Uncharacterized protein n=1 Tax=Elysia marginata TaxID=1093978 RepID=A0AAV4H342_9GAST|nr:hypothetical protein ElyMa_006170300 [Elysia marginata]
MPSAARQKLPPEMWRCGKNPYPFSGPANSYGSFAEMQVSPGHYDVMPDEKQLYHSHKKASGKPPKRHNQGRKSPKSLLRKGSGAGALSDPEMESLEKSFAAKLSPSSSVQSDSGISYTTKSGSEDVYALENWPAPDPSELPFPPLEWLRPPTGKTSPVSSDFCSNDLKKLLSCTIMA